MSIKLRKILESDSMIQEKAALPPWKLDQISKEIVTKYFASVHGDGSRMSHYKDGVQQNKMLKDLTTSIKGAIKSVLKNYPNVYALDDKF